MNAIARAATALTALVALFAAPTAHADGDATTDSVPRMLPYQGVLEIDGRPVDANGDRALSVVFELYDGPEAEAPTYRQPMQIEVYAGRFTATIGPTGLGPDDAPLGIDAVIRAADDLYLGLTLLGDPDDPADDVRLQNRQRIHASPFALWTTAATDISVARNAVIAGDAIVGGSLVVAGDVTLPQGSLDGDEITDGTVRLGDFAPDQFGEGLATEAGALGVDTAWLDDRIRTWTRAHCQVRLGWRNGCTNCQDPPFKEVAVQANGVCVDARGADTSCRDGGRWGGVNTDANVGDNDTFYIRLVCD